VFKDISGANVLGQFNSAKAGVIGITCATEAWAPMAQNSLFLEWNAEVIAETSPETDFFVAVLISI